VENGTSFNHSRATEAGRVGESLSTFRGSIKVLSALLGKKPIELVRS
jgi:hypothetical protein